ncbi:helix-turn-helix domain-containing protein [Herbaspirillum sp. BH-1]|uniref:helix-turn-helix domain-containing protein n=1 Tax=Herbaspirillum sp. (strain BH-1) TaxID=2058884 RepID=UPI000C884949|nr:helix-turn-helix transcriptional regulator [Herbaspirillum sp. BH-1]
MNTIGERLKAERTRLGFNQTEFAAVGGVQRRAQVFYEQDERRPDAGYLLAVSRLGVDIQFVVTGIPSVQALTDDEALLIDGFRKLDLKNKARVLGVVEGAGGADTSSPVKKTAPTVTFHGSVGQQITGDITAPQTINVGRKKK